MPTVVQQSSRIVIIGGGISGLASAALLARDGHEVTVVEAHAEVGGRAGSWSNAGFRFDTGPSWYLMPEVFDHFYRLLGTSAAEQLNLVTLDPGYRVFFEGNERHLDISAHRDENLELFEKVRRGSGRRLDRYLKSAAETYDLVTRHFLYSSFESLRPLLVRPVLGRLPHLIRLLAQPLSSRAWLGMRDDRLRKILGHPATLLGSSPYLAPSIYHLMSHFDLEQGVRYPIGGFVRVIQSVADLAKAEGATIRTKARVTKITVEGGKATGVEYVGADRRKHSLAADIVVSATDLHHSETELLEKNQQTYPQGYWDSSTSGPSALLIYLGVEGELPQLQHHSVFFAKDWRGAFDNIFGRLPKVSTPPWLYVGKPSGLDPDVAPEGHENLFVHVPLPADASFGKGGIGGKGDTAVEELADAIIKQIAVWADIPDLASRIVLRRTVGPTDFAQDLNAWKGTALGPAHTVQQSGFMRARNKSRRVKGLYYVGAFTTPGVGLPLCLVSAEVLLKRLRGDKSTGPLPAPLVRRRRGADQTETV
jgi:1-hydroxy-2-isopentenylcarotenoid 3,4-desaturase